MTDNCGKTALGHRGLLWGAFALCATMVLPSFAAQNCISNGDFELPAANYRNGTQYAYNNQSGGSPTGWTIKVRRGAKGGKIVSWDEAPSNLATLTFVRNPSDSRSYGVIKKDDGVYIVSGLTVIVR